MNLLGKLCREHGCTLVVVTHDAHVAALADRTLSMVDGRLAPVALDPTRGHWLI